MKNSNNKEVNNFIESIDAKPTIFWGWIKYYYEEAECILWRVRSFFYDVVTYFKNIIRFHKNGVLWNYRPWDYSYTIDLFVCSLKDLKKSIENGNEIRESASKKITAIQMLIDELSRNWEDDFETSNTITDVNTKNQAYYKAKEEHYNRIFKLIKGQNLPYNDPNFDGSGIDGWWD